MKRFTIAVAAGRCSGCLRCQLACSDLYTGEFNPARARLRVELREGEANIAFTEECAGCGTCTDDCFYGALTKAPAAAGP